LPRRCFLQSKVLSRLELKRSDLAQCKNSCLSRQQQIAGPAHSLDLFFVF